MSNVIIKNPFKSNINENRLRGYIFDWDDNILHMPTTIKMDKLVKGKWVPISVSTEDFANVRHNTNYRIRNNNPNEAYKDFRTDSSFITDTNNAIYNNMLAPSFEKFKEALIYANNFAINTARGHSPKALRDGVLVVINLLFSDDEIDQMVENIKDTLPVTRNFNDIQSIEYYLDHMGEYYPVSSKEFSKRFGLESDASNPEHSKKLAIEHFVKTVLENVKEMVDGNMFTKVSFGFSDDDVRNIKAAETFIEEELRHIYPEIHFVVYDTSDKGNKKIVVHKIG